MLGRHRVFLLPRREKHRDRLTAAVVAAAVAAAVAAGVYVVRG